VVEFVKKKKYFTEWEGFGTLIFQNGDKFVGGFKGGNINGHGTYYSKNKN